MGGSKKPQMRCKTSEPVDPRCQTTCGEMSAGLAESGTEKWPVNTSKLTMIFYDRAGNEMLVEGIK
jgi:hypothetical protein